MGTEVGAAVGRLARNSRSSQLQPHIATLIQHRTTSTTAGAAPPQARPGTIRALALAAILC